MRPVNVLLLGDSIDFRIARHLCNISKHEEHLETFTDDPIGQEHNMTGPFPVLRALRIDRDAGQGWQTDRIEAFPWSCIEGVRLLYMALLRVLKAARSGVQGSAGRQSWL